MDSMVHLLNNWALGDKQPMLMASNSLKLCMCCSISFFFLILLSATQLTNVGMTYNFVEIVTSYKITRTDNNREVHSVHNSLWLRCGGTDCIAIKAEVIPFHFAQLLAMNSTYNYQLKILKESTESGGSIKKE